MSLLGAAICSGSVNIAMFIVFRFVHGFGLGMIICLVPLYISEVAPPHRRGALSGMTVMGLVLGYLM
jgi:MFS family permease